jgi:hypothetical protein
MKKTFSDAFSKTLTVASGKRSGSNADTQRKSLNIHKSSGSHNREEKQLSIIDDIVTPTISQSSTAQHVRKKLNK